MIAYLFSRYPVISQTFCDTEMIALRKMGVDVQIYSIHSPRSNARHGYQVAMAAGVNYAPPYPVFCAIEEAAIASGSWPASMVADHDRRYGPDFKAATRAKNALWLAHSFRRRGVKHCHVHFANRAAHTALFLKSITGIPFSMTIHGQDFMVDLASDELLDEICREAAFVVAVSDFSRELLMERCPSSKGKVHRIYNGLDTGLWKPEIEVKSAQQPLKLVSVGRLIPLKGFAVLVKACAKLKERGVSFECAIVGEGEQHAELSRHIDKLGLRKEVVLSGELPQERVRTLLSQSDLFVLACRKSETGAHDVLPTVILEAMAAGLPVISTRIGGVPELVVNGETGFLVEPDDEDALAERIATLARDQELRQKFGAAGRDRLVEQFSVQSAAEGLKELFTAVTSGVKANPAVGPGRWTGLVIDWPPAKPFEQEIRSTQTGNSPSFCIVARMDEEKADSSDPILKCLEFCPPTVVMSANWDQPSRERDTILSAIQTCGCDLDAVREIAQIALSLNQMLRLRRISHVHAYGVKELFCAWLVRKLANVSVSVTFEPSFGAGTVFPKYRWLPLKEPDQWERLGLKLAADCVGGRVFDARLLPHLPVNRFQTVEEWSGKIWERQLFAWAVRSPLGAAFKCQLCGQPVFDHTT